jgi:hypothetical protein
MGSEQLSVEIGNCDPVIVPAKVIHVVDNGFPDDTLDGVDGSARFPTYAEHRT